MQKTLLAFILFIVLNECYSQNNNELFSFNYLMVPIGNDDVDLYKTDVKFNVPIKLKRGRLINSFGFDNYHFNYTDSSFQYSELENFYNINYNVSYIYPISEKWKLSTRVGISIASNLEGSITSEDFNYNAGLMGIHTFGNKKSPSILAFGLAYATIAGEPGIIPIINFRKIVNQKFSYGIGFPRSFATYQYNDRNSISSEIALSGFYSNLRNNVQLGSGNVSEKASLLTVNLGISYDYKLDKNWSINFKGGYSIYNNYELLDGNNDSVYEFEINPKPYFSTGIKFRLKNKLKQKQNDK